MSLYKFNVTLSAADAQKFANPNDPWSIALEKTTAVSGGKDSPTIQWLAQPVLAPNITVEWTANYGVFFTTTNLVEGAIITQNAPAPAVVGKQYSYSAATFTDSPGSAGSITITNMLAAEYEYGISQSFYDPSTNSNLMSPISVTKITANGGSATFSPTEKITMYFTQSNVSGIVNSNKSNPQTVILTAGKYPTYNYNNGVWTTVSDPSSISASRSELIGKKWEYAFRFSKWVIAPTFVIWLGKKYDKYTITSQSPDGERIVVEVTGSSDPSKSIEALKGTKYTPPDTLTRVAKGAWLKTGEIVTIEDVTEIVSEKTKLWNAVYRLQRGKYHSPRRVSPPRSSPRRRSSGYSSHSSHTSHHGSDYGSDQE